MLEFIKKLGFKPTDEAMLPYIREWLEWYQGKVGSFHSYTQYNGKKAVGRERASLGMAKRVCEDWANLLLNERADIRAQSDAAEETLKAVLDDNGFRVRGNRLLELAFALGTGAICEYFDGKRTRLDFIRADMIFPLSVESGIVTQCAFCSEVAMNGEKYVYVQLHGREGGKYVVRNRLFDRRTGLAQALPAGLRSDYHTERATPLFQIITPNIVNSIDPSSGMGISVFAGAIDILKGIDLVYDSYQNEFRLGKKRILVPLGMARMSEEKAGVRPVFDDNDTEFYAFPDQSLTDLKEINMTIRAQEHREGLDTNLALLSARCGLGSQRYTYPRDGNAVKTATEVISENSALYQNLRKHELVLEGALKDMARGILFLEGADENDEICVDFDDSIIQDKDAERARDAADVTLGVMAAWEYRMKYYGETEAEAKAKTADMGGFGDEE